MVHSLLMQAVAASTMQRLPVLSTGHSIHAHPPPVHNAVLVQVLQRQQHVGSIEHGSGLIEGALQIQVVEQLAAWIETKCIQSFSLGGQAVTPA